MIIESKLASMSPTIEAPARPDKAVNLADVARQLDIPRHVSRKFVEQGLVTPVYPVYRGGRTYISAEDAERIRRAALKAAEIGVAIVIVLKVLRAVPM